MKFLALLAALLAAVPFAFSAPFEPAKGTNPYVGRKPLVNRSYAAKLEQTIKTFLDAGDTENAGRVRSVQAIPTFAWVSDSASIADIKPLVSDAVSLQRQTGEKYLVQLVIYNLPDRDCSAKASDGEFHLVDDGFRKYQQYIDDIVKELSTPDAQELHFSIILEPDSLGNIVTNMNVEKCANAASAYIKGIAHTIASLQKPNIDIYIDAAHGGWLGWNANLGPSADLFQQVLDLARESVPDAKVRGLSINVSNYNQFIATVREDFTQWNDSWDEFHYVDKLVPYLEAVGFPTHFIVDQGRAGKAGIRTEWGRWCNVKNAGYGTRPTSDPEALQNEYVDAIVWVKPGGESDGTSDTESRRFDANCRSPVAHVPAPESGQWFNDYVVNLVLNASPPLEPTL